MRGRMRPTFERPEMYLLLFAAALLGAAAETLDFCVDDGTWTTVAGSGAWAFGSSYGGEDCPALRLTLLPSNGSGAGRVDGHYFPSLFCSIHQKGQTQGLKRLP